ncbi:DUF6443 domain-containing protein [Hymenobacter latericus]|uniref:DUF6443 domain-containing protein n=1 Tax=Hymenobacter sp. YIM 151858-1 TaxID=2987688 RepID=UPI0022270C79|nr:DUF6443 domain-containing protein [Hymenobacter sp. YIM 151858-1]UYZ61208.1 DUF6443 domain-containing protein [Hymenobacter sp. YIM 151858-1]
MAGQGLVADSTELRVLRQFYYATGGPQWMRKDNWLLGTSLADVGNWYGVRVANGDVTYLNLYANNLKGSIPPCLGELRGLQELALWQNWEGLTGAIPAELGQLSQLRSLSLQQNQLAGPIPASLGRLRQLTALNLYHNRLSGSIPVELTRLANLQYLSLNANGLGGAIPDSVSRLRRLRTLDLGVNPLIGPLPPGLGQLDSLESLQLWQNQFRDSIPAAWGGLRQLRVLHMSQSQVRGRLPKELGQLVNLEVVSLTMNELRGAVPAELGNWHRVRAVNLEWNQLAGALPGTLGQWQHLEDFNAHNNQLTGPLPGTLGKWTKVRFINLHNNRLTGNLPEALGRLRQLQLLQLTNNQLSGRIPDSLGCATALQSLHLSGNRFTGHAPAALGRLTNLYELVLWNNQLTGPLPDEWSQLGNLVRLELSGNRLTGSLPASWGNLRSLQRLLLHNNYLTGGIPRSWQQLGQLYELRLRDNRLSGPLTDSLGVETLDLANNRLRGAVPVFYARSPRTRYLLLNGNDFNYLPSFLEHPLGDNVVVTAQGNYLDFASIERNLTRPDYAPFAFFYGQQRQRQPADTVAGVVGQRLILHRGMAGRYNRYQWQRRVGEAWVDIPGATDSTYVIARLDEASEGAYQVRVTNDWVRWTGLLTRPLWVDMLPYSPLPYNEPVAANCPTPVTPSLPTARSGSAKPVNYVRTYTPQEPLTDLAQARQAAPPAPTGQVLWEYWGNYSGTIADVPVNTPPHRTELRGLLEGPSHISDSYASRLRGYVYPPETGDYTFWVAGDDNCELYLSSDDNPTRKTLIATVPGWTSERQWSWYAQQRSAPVRLEAGRRYYVEARQQEWGGGDNLAVAWQLPSGTFEGPIPGNRLAPLVVSGGATAAVDPSQVAVKTEYADGLGRPLQTVLHRQSPAGRDVVQPVAYDALGRQPKQYLPYTADGQTAAASGYYPNALREQPLFYGGTGADALTQQPLSADAATQRLTATLPKTGVAFTEVAFEPSPLNRVLAQASPGESWALSTGRAVTFGERPNANADAVRRWQPGYGTQREELSSLGTYAAGELWVKETRDEQGQRVQEYADKEGQVVLKQVELTRPTQAQASAEPAKGSLCVMQQEGSGWLTLTAPAGSVITGIEQATYGRGSGVDCATFAFEAGCSADVTAAVRQRVAAQLAANSTSVRIWVSNEELNTDPCIGHGKTLRVKATCGPVPAPDQWLSTYYVYDDFGRLRAVLPPKAVQQIRQNNWQVTGAGVERLLFRYHHDAQGRLVEKQVPDQDGYQYTVYDELDRPVLTQDVAQRARGEWTATKYDALGRVVYTALTRFPELGGTPAQVHRALQNQAAAASRNYEAPSAAATLAHAYYSNQAFPQLKVADQLLTVSYYDGYDFNRDGQADAQYAPPTTAQLGGDVPQADTRVTGLATRSLVRVLGVAETEPGAWLSTTTFFDEKARPIQVQSTNARGGRDVVTTRYDFSGKALGSYATHQGPNHAELAVRETQRYDHAGRLLETKQQLDHEAEVTLAAHTYNELGQVESKAVGNALQTLNYRYNVRGWLTQLNNPEAPLAGTGDVFALSLHYDCGFEDRQYNGNIAGQTWRGYNDNVQRAYGYRYDNLSRLLQGDFVARTGPAAGAGWGAERSNYRFWGASYDANGNLLTLRRRGLVQAATRTTPARYAETDNLRYRYQPAAGSAGVASNRLLRVDDLAPAASSFGAKQPARPDFSDGATNGSAQPDYASQGAMNPDYTYNAAGSLVSDRNKGIARIRYNYLHLPQSITWSSGDSLQFRYTAAGQKVAKLAYAQGQPAVRTDYLGAWQYEGDSLRWLSHGEGRVLRFVQRDAANQVQTRYVHEYTLKDHLGNLRAAVKRGERLSYYAGLDSNPEQTQREQQLFDSASVSPPVRTPASRQFVRSGDGVARLSAGGTRPAPMGVIKQLAVAKGDTVSIEAYGLYLQPVQDPQWGFSLASFVASLLPQQPAPLPSIEGTKRARVLPLLSLGLGLVPALPQLPGGVPKAYARLLVFDADSNLVAQHTVPLTAAANGGYERLFTQVVAPRAGFVTVYVGNESLEEVYFDDITVEHRQGLQVQETQYDPYGLELAGLNKAPALENKYTWNGKERQDEFGLRWHDHGWRFFDPTLGRWSVVDPDAEEADQESWGTYHFGLDNAVRYNDLDGKAPGEPVGEPPTVARGIVDFAASSANVFFSSWAYATGSSTKLQAQVYEDEVSMGIHYATVPVGGTVQEAKSFGLDALSVGLNFLPTGKAGAGRLFEQGAKKVVAAEVAQGSITGYTRHGLNQAVNRNGGKGVKASAIVDAVSNPKKIAIQPNGNTSYKGGSATVIKNPEGKVVTTFGKARGPKAYAEPRPQRRDAAPGGGAAQRRALKETGANYNPGAIR